MRSGGWVLLGHRPGSGPPDRVRGRLGQALRGDDGGGAAGSTIRQAQGRLSGDAGMWFDSALRRLRAGSP